MHVKLLEKIRKAIGQKQSAEKLLRKIKEENFRETDWIEIALYGSYEKEDVLFLKPDAELTVFIEHVVEQNKTNLVQLCRELVSLCDIDLVMSINEALEQHKLWIKDNAKGKIFSLKNLRNADLRGANLSNADLTNANLRGADLRGANLSGAHLCGANLSGANLAGANMRKAHLFVADLSGADLSGADLSGARLCIADLRKANLRKTNLREANIREANLKGADLSGADLSGAILKKAKGVDNKCYTKT